MSTRTITLDCHAYPWHEPNEEYPECGPENLVRMAETFGVIIRYLPDHPNAGWAWWYEVTGPYDNVLRFLVVEYTGGDEAQARELLEGE